MLHSEWVSKKLSSENNKVVYIQPYYSWVVKIKTNILFDLFIIFWSSKKKEERDGREERKLICLYYL